MRLLLVRHGQTPSNVAAILDAAAPGPGLTEHGHRQAAALPQVLEGRPVDGVAVSTLVRTRLTAQPLLQARGLEPLVFDGLREIESGDFEGSTDPAEHQQYRDVAFSWARGQLAARLPGGPDGHDFFARFDGAVAEVAAQDWDSAVIFSHGAALRCWTGARVAGLDADQAEATPLANTGAFDLEGDPASGWRLLAWHPEPLGGEFLEDAAPDPTAQAD